MGSADDRTKTAEQPPADGVLRRWSRLKQAARSREAPAPAADAPPAPAVPATPALSDADMPPVDSLDADSDYSGFLSPGVSKELRQLALRKLFGSPALNFRDGLDDYDDDYRNFETLGELLVEKLRQGGTGRQQAGTPDTAQPRAEPALTGDGAAPETAPPEDAAPAQARAGGAAPTEPDDSSHA